MIRNFTASDHDAFLAMAREFYTSDAVMHSVPESCFEATFAHCLAGSSFVRGLILESEGQTAGYALLSFTYSNEVGGLVVLVEEVYVLPQFQGKGLGREFFAFVEAEYEGRAKRYRLEVTRCNQRAISLYRRLGFEELDYVQMIKDR